MRKLFAKLWSDESGFIVSVELLFVCVILVIGLTGGLAALRSAVVSELAAVGAAIEQLDPGYNIVSVGSKTGSSNGTLVTHVPSSLAVGAANAVTSNTTTGNDAIKSEAPFASPITP
jgi:hypothetical protein